MNLGVSVTSALNQVCLENLAVLGMLVANEACAVAATEPILLDYL